MSDFPYCPDCAGSCTIEGKTCTRCSGSGQRKRTEENLMLALTAREWADDQVSEFFSDWCRITDTHAAYGVESWNVWGDKIRIVQDTSCRGCYDCETHEFPIAWLVADSEEREQLIREDMAIKKAAADKKLHAQRRYELEQARRDVARLEAEMDGV